MLGIFLVDVGMRPGLAVWTTLRIGRLASGPFAREKLAMESKQISEVRKSLGPPRSTSGVKLRRGSSDARPPVVIPLKIDYSADSRTEARLRHQGESS